MNGTVVIDRMEKIRRLAAAVACLVVGGSSFALSYVALRDVAIQVGAVPAYLGFLVPIVVDGGVICGSAIIWSLSKSEMRRPAFPFLFVGALVMISVVINANHAGNSILAKGIAALPPLILLGTLELVASQGRRFDARNRAFAATQTATPTVTTVTSPQPQTAAAQVSQPRMEHVSRPVLADSVIPAQRRLVTAPAPVLNAVDDEGSEGSYSNLDAELAAIVDNPTVRSNRAGSSRRPLRVRAQEAQ